MDGRLARSEFHPHGSESLVVLKLRSNSTLARRSPLGEGWVHLRGSITFLLLCAALFLGGVYYFRSSFDRQIGDAVLAHLNHKLSATGWQVEFRKVQVLTGSGLRIRDLELRHREAKQPALTVDSLEVRVPLDLSKPDTWNIRPEAIIFDKSVVKIDVLQWSGPQLSALLAAVCPLENPPPPTIPLVVRNATVRLFHPLSSRFGPVAFHDVQLLAQSQTANQHSVLAIQGLGNSAEAGTLQWNLAIDRCARTFAADIQFAELAFSEKWLGLAPPEHQARLEDFHSLRGLFSGTAHLSGRLGPMQVQDYEVVAQLNEGTAEHGRLREPLSAGQAQLRLTADQWEVTNLTARLGPGSLKANLRANPHLAPLQWQLQGDWLNCHFDRDLIAAWPTTSTRVLNELNPRGLVDLHFQFSGDESIRQQSCLVEIRQGEFELARFPYPVSHCVGVVRLEGEHCQVNVQALEAGQLVDIRGEAWGLLSQPTFDFRFDCDGFLPFNDKLLNALQRYPKTMRQLELLNPRGYFGVTGTFRRLQPGTPNQLEYAIELKQCSIRHQLFPWPVRDVEGLARVNGSEVQFERLRGRNGASTVTGSGNFRPADGLHLKLVALNVPLSQELRQALQPNTQRVWDALRPTGEIAEVRVDLRQVTGANRPDIAVDFDLHRKGSATEPNASIAPVAFPYALSRLRGNVQVANGRISLKEIEGEHGRCWLNCSGNGSYDDANWRVDLSELQMGAIKVDEDLLAAMPGKLQAACRELRFEGLLNLAGAVSLQGGVNPALAAMPVQPGAGPIPFDDLRSAPHPAPGFQLDWNVRLDTDAARLRVGVPLENVSGSVQLQGRYNGQTTQCRGKLKLDSLSLLRMQVTQVEGPLWLDDNRAAVGSFAAPLGQTAGESLRGTLYSGQIHLDGQSWVENGRRFYLHTTLANAQLAPLAQLWAPQVERLTGLAQGWLRLWGDSASLDTLQGDGTIKLHDAYIFELPVFLATMRQLSRPDVDTRAFDSSLAQFAIGNRQIQFQRMEFNGDALSLIGEGKIDFDRRVDLNFYTMMGRNRFYIPLLTELARASSQQFFWIEVTGDLANPQTTRKLLPVLNDGLRRLLGVPETQPAGAGPPGSLRLAQERPPSSYR